MPERVLPKRKAGCVVVIARYRKKAKEIQQQKSKKPKSELLCQEERI
jgi:hypothetical protein